MQLAKVFQLSEFFKFGVDFSWGKYKLCLQIAYLTVLCMKQSRLLCGYDCCGSGTDTARSTSAHCQVHLFSFCCCCCLAAGSVFRNNPSSFFAACSWLIQIYIQMASIRRKQQPGVGLAKECQGPEKAADCARSICQNAQQQRGEELWFGCDTQKANRAAGDESLAQLVDEEMHNCSDDHSAD